MNHVSLGTEIFFTGLELLETGEGSTTGDRRPEDRRPELLEPGEGSTTGEGLVAGGGTTVEVSSSSCEFDGGLDRSVLTGVVKRFVSGGT